MRHQTKPEHPIPKMNNNAQTTKEKNIATLAT